MSLFTRPRETRSISYQEVWGTGHDWAPMGGSPQDALLLGVVRACVGLRSRLLGQIPFNAYRDGSTGPEKLATQPLLLVAPSSLVERPVWMAQLSISLDLWGNAYGLVTSRDRVGYPTQVTWLDPSLVHVTEATPGARATYKYNEHTIPDGDLIHVAMFVPPGTCVGLSPLARNGLVELGRRAQEFGRRWFAEGAHPSVVLRPPANADLGEEGAQRLKDKWKQMVGRGGGIGVLSKAVDIERVSTPANESQFLETIRANQVDICMAFGVPPEMVGVATSGSSVTYSNRDQRLADFMVTSLNYDLAVLQSVFSGLLPRPQYVRFNTGALLRSDLMTRYQAHAIALDPTRPFKTLNEVRRDEESSTVEFGDSLAPRAPAQPAPAARQENHDA